MFTAVSPDVPVEKQTLPPVSDALLGESVSPISSKGPSPPPIRIRTSLGLESEDDENDGISVTPSPTNKGIQEKREFLPVSHVLKVIVLGDASVGKTALIQRFVHGSYQVLPYKPTVGADFYSQKLELVNSNTGEKSLVTLQIWDTAGQERYRSLASSFYRGADVCVLVYDGTRASSLTSLEVWKSDFLRHAQPNDPESFPFIFLRNKSDLLTVADSPSADEQLSSIPAEFEVPQSRVVSVSAKAGTNVEKVFHLAAKIGVKRALKSSKLTMNAINSATSSSRIVNLANRTSPSAPTDNYCQC